MKKRNLVMLPDELIDTVRGCPDERYQGTGKG